MIDKIIKIIPSLEGKVLTIGFDEESKLLQKINKNNKITFYSCLTDLSSKKNKDKGKRKRFFRNKSVSKKNLYKALKKEKFDYIICDFNLIKSNFNNFIKNSYKMTPKKIYYLLDNEIYDYEEIDRRYKRYNANVLIKGSNNEYLIEIDVSNMKMPLNKRFIYSFRDIFYNIIEFIASIIIS